MFILNCFTSFHRIGQHFITRFNILHFCIFFGNKTTIIFHRIPAQTAYYFQPLQLILEKRTKVFHTEAVAVILFTVRMVMDNLGPLQLVAYGGNIYREGISCEW